MSLDFHLWFVQKFKGLTSYLFLLYSNEEERLLEGGKASMSFTSQSKNRIHQQENDITKLENSQLA